MKDTTPTQLVHWGKPSLSLLVKLGSLIVHADEALSKDGHPFDIRAFQDGMKDPEVKAWIEMGGAYLPLKRKQ